MNIYPKKLKIDIPIISNKLITLGILNSPKIKSNIGDKTTENNIEYTNIVIGCILLPTDFAIIFINPKQNEEIRQTTIPQNLPSPSWLKYIITIPPKEVIRKIIY
jgi:hypothetical protein